MKIAEGYTEYAKEFEERFGLCPRCGRWDYITPKKVGVQSNPERLCCECWGDDYLKRCDADIREKQLMHLKKVGYTLKSLEGAKA